MIEINTIRRLLRKFPVVVSATLLASILLVSGCGQNGPLYLPNDQSGQAENETEDTEDNKEESTE